METTIIQYLAHLRSHSVVSLQLCEAFVMGIQLLLLLLLLLVVCVEADSTHNELENDEMMEGTKEGETAVIGDVFGWRNAGNLKKELSRPSSLEFQMEIVSVCE